MKSLLARLLLVVSLALVPALGFQAYTESQARHVRQKLVEDEAVRLVRLVSSEQKRIVEGAEQVLNAIGGSPVVQDNMPELCQRMLANLLEQSPRYNYAAVIGLDGRLVCAPGPLDRGMDASDRGYFRLALQTGSFVIGDYTIDRTSGRPGIPMAKRFSSRDGKVAGLVEVVLDIDWLGQQIAHLALPPEAAASIVDRNGTVLARYPDGARYIGKPIPSEDRFSLEGDEVRVAPMRGLDGRQRIAAYSPLGADPKGLRIWVGLDREITFAAVTQANRTGLLLIIAGAALALAITVLVGTRLIRHPVNRLLRVADRWRTGDLAARTGLREDGSEFGRLAAAFDRMAVAQEGREHNLHTALESTTDSVMMFDRDWRITYLSARAKAHVAQGRDLVGQVVWDALPGTGDSVFATAYRAAMESGVPTHTVGYSAAFKTHFEAHAYPSRDSLTVFFRDLTEERRISAELAGSEARLRLAQEAAGIGLWEYDFASQTMSWSPEQYRLHGRDPAAGPPTFPQWLELVEPEDRASILDAEAALQAPDAGSLRMEFRIRRSSDGARRWLASLGRLVRDDAGHPSRLVGANLDVTEQRRAEEDVRRATALLRAIGNCSPDPIYAKDADGRFLFANPAVLAVIGKTADEVLGRTDAEWHRDPEQAAAVMANDRRVIGTGRAEILEETFHAAGLGTRVYRSAKAPLRADDGTPLGIVAVSSDITQLKDAEGALRESEQRFRKLFDGAPLPNYLVDPSDASIVDCNDAAAAMLGYERDVLRCMRLADIDAAMGGDERVARERMIAGESVQFETRHRTRSGELRDVVISSVPLDIAGRRLALGTVVDITDRKRAEAELRRLTVDLEARVREEIGAREAAQARAAHAERMQALGQLAGGIAHDFNNVLQAVEGAATLIERCPGDEAGVRRFARMTIDAAERGAAITRRLLAFGHRADLRAETLDVAALLSGLHEILIHTLGAAIDVEVRPGAHLPPLLADKGQLETALVNLATNARDAMPEGGRLTLSAETEIVSRDGSAHAAGLASGRYVRFTVADTGMGMETATLARASEPFFTTKGVGAGTGLGLPMAKGFAEQSGGALSIESCPGKGTTVTLWLPEAGSDRGPGATGVGAPASRMATTVARVLLVDDEDLVREALAANLEIGGYSVLVAASGTEALALLGGGEEVDVLVTDLSMPGMDGLAVIRAAQESRPGLPAVLLTGYAADDTALAVGGAVRGAFSLLRKPVSSVQLVDRIRALLAARQGITR